MNDNKKPRNTLELGTLESIRTRRTIKVLSDTPLPTTPTDTLFVETLLESAYWAPFHYTAHSNHKNELSSCLPFRFYVLDSTNCRALAQKFIDNTIEADKVTKMLNTTDYLFQATWTPHPSNTPSNELFEANLTNMEHIATAGAAIQNLLLTATALGRENYWGSGGILRQDFAFDWLNIPKEEILLGSLFIFPSVDDIQKLADNINCKTSPKREKRGNIINCYRWVTL